MVGPIGLEPMTSSLSGTRSSQLSYGPIRRHLPKARPRQLTMGSRPRGLRRHVCSTGNTNRNGLPGRKQPIFKVVRYRPTQSINP